MAAIENYINNYKKSNPLKMFNNVSYKSTKDMVAAADVDRVKEPTVITVSYWNYVFLFSPVFLLAVFYSCRSASKSIINILPLVIVLVIAIILIRQAIVKKNNSETEVYADKDKLVIKKQTFQWKDVANAYIMTDNAGRTPDKFLLLELNNGEINKISISQIGISGKQLAAIVEYYKKTK
ncbi:hypothetical protein SAMN05421821_102121 [Mucilaginibacter lappiensis]|uniref:YcxB-like protein n=1 Tax=Mucilaginibacter lappiensis TaxID=354630 RepID=A0ABR6PHB9_9SPHI|nr:hypothetical protein [Mucilaginibacter lappiensis]MBB6108644.1 hypothetical protein [Mucilaginibacter lappiensis]SIQ29594.1 hypothetical protein SAMN05421821_102121 [Mucilaginibacter lappiensis]